MQETKPFHWSEGMRYRSLIHRCDSAWHGRTIQFYEQYTLQGINISHLGKRKIIFKMQFLGGYVSFLEGMPLLLQIDVCIKTHTY